MTQYDATHTYREINVRSASQVELVIMMYDMIIEDVHHATNAIAGGNIEARTDAVKHAMSVLEQLQGTLNMNLGGEAARNLDAFYSIARAKLLEAHIKCSAELMRAQAELFADLRAAWKQILHQADTASGTIAMDELERTSMLPDPSTASALTEASTAREWTA